MPWYGPYGVCGHAPHSPRCLAFALLARISSRELASYLRIEERELEVGGVNPQGRKLKAPLRQAWIVEEQPAGAYREDRAAER